mgnify:CR=1 FL=1
MKNHQHRSNKDTSESTSLNAHPLRVTAPWLADAPRPITCLTAYDFTMAALLDKAGIDLILVGDSLASPMQGKGNTLPVTMDQMVYHCACVTAGVQRAFVVGDMPFLSYQVSTEEAVRNAGRLVQEGGVGGVKLEGGAPFADTIRAIVRAEIPVVGHIGLTPQSVNRMGGYRVQGKGKEGEKNFRSRTRSQILADARAVESAGAFCLVVEGVPSELGAEISREISIPTIGIGAGNSCRGQILVTHDMLGLSLRESPKFVKQFGNLQEAVLQSVVGYVSEVIAGNFPGPEHSYGDR